MLTTAEYAKLQTLCQRSFPERLDQSLAGIRPLSQGGDRTMAFSLAWHEGRRRRVEQLLLWRYDDRRTSWSLDDEDKVQRAWRVIRWLYGLGFPVPLLYASGIRETERYLLMARPAGSAPRIVDSAWRRTPFVKEVGTLLARLHERTPPAAVRQILPEINARKEIMRINKLARRHGDNALREASDELAEQEIEGQAFPLCVVHGAVAIDALLCDAQGITTVLGWENAALADPRWDVASFTIELRAHDAGDLVDPFWAAYSDRAGIQLANPDYWEALAALQRWAMAGDTAQPQDPWRQEAWHALTRLRYRQEHASTSDDNKQDR